MQKKNLEEIPHSCVNLEVACTFSLQPFHAVELLFCHWNVLMIFLINRLSGNWGLGRLLLACFFFFTLSWFFNLIRRAV